MNNKWYKLNEEDKPAFRRLAITLGIALIMLFAAITIYTAEFKPVPVFLLVLGLLPLIVYGKYLRSYWNDLILKNLRLCAFTAVTLAYIAAVVINDRKADGFLHNVEHFWLIMYILAPANIVFWGIAIFEKTKDEDDE